MINLLSHMSAGIRTLLLDSLKAAVGNPAQIKFLRAFLKNLTKSQKRREKLEASGLHVPPFLIASITANCNLFCTGCYARANQQACGGSQGKLPLDASRWDSLFTEAKEMGVCFILLAGGEPMLRLDVLEAAGKHPEIIFPVFTNGTLLSGEVLDFFEKHRNLIPVISLEGSQQTTDNRRGAGVYEKVNEAMAALKTRHVFFGTSITVTSENIPSVTAPDFANEVRAKGCSLVFYVEYVPADQVSSHLAPTAQDRVVLEKNTQVLKDTSGMLIISFPGDEKETGGCLAAGRGFVHINMDGSVEPCPFSPYSDTNLKDISLAQALQSPFLSRMREGGFLMGEHVGGCLLFEKQEEVQELLKDALG